MMKQSRNGFPWWLLTLEAVAVVLFMALAARWVTGCVDAPSKLPTQCDPLTRAKVEADCALLIAHECIAGTPCQMRAICEATLLRWQDCDAGAP